MYKLRELDRKDIPQINIWRNDPQLIELLGAPFRYINQEVDIKWFESYMANRGNAIRCAIVDTEHENKVLGLISLVSIDYINQSAVLSIMIGERENRGKGLGSFAIREMLWHAFRNMNLQRIELTVLQDNSRARHVYEKMGFIYEGTKRKSKYKDGKFVDMMQYAILRDEYEKKFGGG